VKQQVACDVSPRLLTVMFPLVLRINDQDFYSVRTRKQREGIHAFAAAQAVCREVLKRGSEDGTFRIPQNDPAALEMAVIGIWSVVHGLTMLYIDGLATTETAETIDSLGEKVVAMFLHGIVEREKQNRDAGTKRNSRRTVQDA
jgi:hypothetical protein